MLNLNCFRDGGALLECEPQGDASIAIKLSAADEAALSVAVGTSAGSPALTRLFLAGAAGQRTAHKVVWRPAARPAS
ncbi:MAG TPA: hypothetical protein VJ739_09670 [Gemmataceae bacterium]|nr:hypothetical protein [Gemmataceae bacterium]